MGTPGQGTLVKVWLKRAHHGPMDAVERALLVAGRGLEENADWDGRRHVTLLDRGAWDEMIEEFGHPVDPVVRRANLLIEGLTLAASEGRQIRVGSALLRIQGETLPCRRMEEAATGLRKALEPDWRAGAWAVVEEGGWIQPGDAVEWVTC